jgi:hypothetical protein
MTIQRSLIFAAIATMNSVAFAQLDLRTRRGSETFNHSAPQGSSETCIVLKHLEDAKYTKKDSETEKDLCALNRGANTAVCPKLNSTNPGLDFFSVPEGWTANQVVAKNCKVEVNGKSLAKKIAKYKLSTSCSYVPSILSYYHISRYLGNILNIPQSVLRTFDRQDHRTYATSALKTLNNTGKSNELIYQTWSGLKSALDAGSASKSFSKLMTIDATHSYGALSRSPKDETSYGEFFNGGKDRAAAFRDKNAIYKLLKNPQTRIGRQWTKKNVQTFQQLVDGSNMIILDTLLSQQDRFGNIHALEKILVATGNGPDFEIKVAKKMEEVPAEMKPYAIPVREMLLKDNDCGVSKENRARKAGLIESLALISPYVYQQLLQLQSNAGDLKEYFKTELLYTAADWKVVTDNLNYIVDVLKARCKKGELVQILDMKLHFSGASLPKYSCELVK